VQAVSILGKTFDCIATASAWVACSHWFLRPWNISMEAFLVSTGVVALAEVGDKTQLLALLLAARFKKPVPIIFGILFATLLNHGLAGAVGGWVTANVEAGTLKWILGMSFLAMAVWVLIPDKLEESDVSFASKLGIFGTTFVAFFLAEMGDKTQIATVAMAAHYSSVLWVVIGTTLGMLIANIPAVLLGDKLTRKIPIRWVHVGAAILFALLGVITLTGLGDKLVF